MARKTHKTEAAHEEPANLPVPVLETPTLADIDFDIDDAEVEADIARKNSVVKAKYKIRYAHRAVEAGLKKKRAKRSAWDWLAEKLADECLNSKDRISIDRFLAVLDANGVDHSKWQNRSKGWEGRLRMTGRLALQRVVAEANVLRLPDGEEMVPPAEWVAKYRN